MCKGIVLIAEDEEKIRSLIRIYLEQNDYKVIAAKHGKQAFRLIQEHEPDLSVLDIMMPEMNGLEVCKEVRKLEQFQHMPIIFLSSLNEKQTIISGLEIGGDDYLTKPFDPNELVARINAILRRSKVKAAPVKKDPIDFYDELTYQEVQIIHLMEKGYTNREIAETLYLTEGTVKVYNHQLFQKLNVKNRTQAIVLAKEMQLI